MAGPRGGHRKWVYSTQQDPIGIAGGANVYGFADGDPVNFLDPFGLCSGPNGETRPCKVGLSAYGLKHGAKLSDLTPETFKKLQAVADKADVDIGINATKNGDHLDPGHAAGTAVDIGEINGKSIGYKTTTFEGMLDAATKLQKAAAEVGGLKETGNLGPAGKFNGADGPKPINDPKIRDDHKNHVHLSYAKP